MYKSIIMLAAAGMTTLTACGSKTDVSEKNFAAAMTQYLDVKGELCLGTTEWPADLSESDLKHKTRQTRRMIALEAAGLVKGEDTEIDAVSLFGKPTGNKITIKRYTLTDAANAFTQQKEVTTISLNGSKIAIQTDLCWGKKVLDKVVKWEGPMVSGDYQEARVYYTYQISNLAEWTNKPEIQEAFSKIKYTLENAGSEEERHIVKLTSEGWEPKGLN
ncbi:MAG: hypothetical protein ACK5ME_01210 [Parahaliea sp.]